MDNSQENISNEEKPEDNIFNEKFDKKDVINPSNDENEPFGEEFDKKDVINSPDEPLSRKITQKDIDRLVAYDDERRKELSFIERAYDFPGMEDKELSIDEALRKNFNDFLIAPKISGDYSNPIHTNRLPADHINDGEGIVEILEDKEFLDQLEHSSVILNRSPEGELENIEILCKCGEKTLIKFDYVEDDIGLTELEGKKIRKELEIEANVIKVDSHEEIFSDINEEDSEVKIIEKGDISKPVVPHDKIVENEIDEEALEDIDARDGTSEDVESKDNASTDNITDSE